MEYCILGMSSNATAPYSNPVLPSFLKLFEEDKNNFSKKKNDNNNKDAFEGVKLQGKKSVS